MGKRGARLARSILEMAVVCRPEARERSSWDQPRSARSDVRLAAKRSSGLTAGSFRVLAQEAKRHIVNHWDRVRGAKLPRGLIEPAAVLGGVLLDQTDSGWPALRESAVERNGVLDLRGRSAHPQPNELCTALLAKWCNREVLADATSRPAKCLAAVYSLECMCRRPAQPERFGGHGQCTTGQASICCPRQLRWPGFRA